MQYSPQPVDPQQKEEGVMAWDEFMDVGKVSVREGGGRMRRKEEKEEEKKEGGERGEGELGGEGERTGRRGGKNFSVICEVCVWVGERKKK